MPPVFAWARPIDATPWLVAIEFPRAVVLAPADRLGRRVAAIAVLLLLIAAVIGWAISTRITTPLRRVTEAAEEVAEGAARGRHRHRSRTTRSDGSPIRSTR